MVWPLGVATAVWLVFAGAAVVASMTRHGHPLGTDWVDRAALLVAGVTAGALLFVLARRERLRHAELGTYGLVLLAAWVLLSIPAVLLVLVVLVTVFR